MFKKGFVLLGSFLLLGMNYGFSQQKACGTADPDHIILHHPNFYEEMIKNLDHLPVQKLNKTTNNNSEYVIPVVVHVVHNNGNEKISIDQIKSQFPSLFNDFRRVPGTPGWGGYGVDTKIEFSLATKDPNGNPTDGVIYIQNATLTDHDQATEETALKSLSRWDPTKYLNIYLVKSITTSTPGVILGYATFPNFTDNTRDGLVIRADCFGNYVYYPQGYYFSSSERFGRTPTHEIGHWLSLFHTFQGGCGTTSCSSSGDQCCDTPPTAQNNFGSPQRQNTCNKDFPDKLDDVRFFMDYIDNNYMNKFSQCQSNRMVSTLNNPSYTRRVNLWTDGNQFATGTGRYKKPMANFWSFTRNTIVGAPVTFIDYSMGLPDNYSWTFSGGTPTTTFTATGSIVDVTFPNPGYYSVTLVVQNQADTASITKTNFIYVSDVSLPMPFTEDFEANNFPPSGWLTVNKDTTYDGFSGITWGRTNLTGSGGFGNSKRSARMIFNSYSDIGQEDELWSPIFNTQAANNVTLEFSVAYVPFSYDAPSGEYDLQVNDTLAVYVSQDGGNTWTRVYYKGGDDLATDVPSTQQVNFYTATQWRKETINLTSYKNTDKLRIKFMTINAFGQSVCIDDFKIYDNTTVSNDIPVLTESDLAVLPNPNSGKSQIFLNLTQPSPVTYEVYDVQGKLILHQNYNTLAQGSHYLPLEINAPHGVYFLKATIANQSFTRKIFVQP